MNDIEGKAEQAIRQQVSLLESRPDLIQAIRQLTTADDIRVAFDELEPGVAEAVLMAGISTLMSCQAVEAIKRQEESGLN